MIKDVFHILVPEEVAQIPELGATEGLNVKPSKKNRLNFFGGNQPDRYPGASSHDATTTSRGRKVPHAPILP